jgi:hypothetical protein
MNKIIIGTGHNFTDALSRILARRSTGAGFRIPKKWNCGRKNTGPGTAKNYNKRASKNSWNHYSDRADENGWNAVGHTPTKH